MVIDLFLVIKFLRSKIIAYRNHDRIYEYQIHKRRGDLWILIVISIRKPESLTVCSANDTFSKKSLFFILRTTNVSRSSRSGRNLPSALQHSATSNSMTIVIWLQLVDIGDKVPSDTLCVERGDQWWHVIALHGSSPFFTQLFCWKWGTYLRVMLLPTTIYRGKQSISYQ